MSLHAEPRFLPSNPSQYPILQLFGTLILRNSIINPVFAFLSFDLSFLISSLCSPLSLISNTSRLPCPQQSGRPPSSNLLLPSKQSRMDNNLCHMTYTYQSMKVFMRTVGYFVHCPNCNRTLKSSCWHTSGSCPIVFAPRAVSSSPKIMSHEILLNTECS